MLSFVISSIRFLVSYKIHFRKSEYWKSENVNLQILLEVLKFSLFCEVYFKNEKGKRIQCSVHVQFVRFSDNLPVSTILCLKEKICCKIR